MAITNILTSDKIQVFRTKFNAAIAEIWISAVDNGDGTVTVTKHGGGEYTFDLGTSFFTKDEINELLVSLTQATTETLGSVELATVDEVNEGSDEERVITPFTAANSTLFPLKGAWDSDSALDGFYLLNFIAFHEGAFYLSLEGDELAGNLAEPGTDDTKWQIVGGSPASVPIPNSTTTYLSLSDLNTSYPSALVGQEILCESITDGPLIYKKGSDGWYTIPLGQVI